ncbi:uncharacterized protein PHACADRAFT_207631 [Phanerochaete carnosa HHB-10118-sp]|uniref:Uncharacterized protein n=1 Tax=Phanerochaete carnosa (strain HHB-10118-sp) TaxID=650164 RepID=K5VXT7_PHACS|nr:uncharacterized protein PHACADRAFT_207631 [Phanerochaete carnosa HHB-10118-sp]EKM56378.1 hypothetical protein PHACADRAFT_207631 [Phanerochaete carnosa HHB-10118-sp]
MAQSNGSQNTALLQIGRWSKPEPIFCVVFSALRVYALWQGSRTKYVFPIIVLTLGLVPIATNIFGWTRTEIVYENSPLVLLSTCNDFINAPPKLNKDAIAADILVLILTWIKSFKQFQVMTQFRFRSSVSAVLLRDGTVYFIALLVINILQLLTFLNSPFEGAYIDGFLQTMPSVLVSRFMLNLRQLNRTAGENNSDARHFSRFSASFRMPPDFLGNIGEPLDHSQSDRVIDDGSDIPEGSQDSLEESSAERAGTSRARRDQSTEAGIPPVLHPSERANEESSFTSSPASSRETLRRELFDRPAEADD